MGTKDLSEDNDKRSEIEQILIENEAEGSKFFVDPFFKSAILGLSEDHRVVYDYQKMIRDLMVTEDMSEEEAEDFIQYNTLRTIPYMGEGAPIIVHELVM